MCFCLMETLTAINHKKTQQIPEIITKRDSILRKFKLIRID